MAAITDQKFAREYYNHLILVSKETPPPACLKCDNCTGLTEDLKKFHCMKFGELKPIHEAWQGSICTSYHDELVGKKG